MASERIERLRKLDATLSPWMAVAVWLDLVAGGIATTTGMRWLYVSLVIVSSVISLWIVWRFIDPYWRDFLAWLLSKSDQARTPTL